MNYQEHNPQGIYGSDDLYGNNHGSQQQQQQQLPVQPSDVESQPAPGLDINNEEQEAPVGCCGFLTVEQIDRYYQPFFNVTSEEVKNRLINVFFPIKPEFQNGPKKNPDLWGPFWSLTTVIFLLGVCGNFANFLSQEKYVIDFDKVPIAAGLIYGFGIGFPVGLSLLIKCFGGDTTPIEVVCLYGYSLAVFGLVAALNSLPYGWVQWLLTIYGFINSTIFIVINIYGDLRNLPAEKKYIILGIIGAFQIGFMIAFKLIFFG